MIWIRFYLNSCINIQNGYKFVWKMYINEWYGKQSIEMIWKWIEMNRNE
jgi:hypothetical protein